MLGLFNKGNLPRPDGKRQSSKAAAEELKSLETQLLTFLNTKQLENSIYNHCFKKCLKLEDSLFADGERDCLSNCHGKATQFFQISRTQFQSVEQNLPVLALGLQGKNIETSN